MKKVLLIALMVAGISLAAEPKGRYAIVLQAGNETNEGMARAVHALLYARELAEKGYEVVLIYDGAGTGWASELRKPENPLHKHYIKLKELGMVEEICDYCAKSFGVKDDLPEQQKKLLVGDYEGHPSLVKWIERGYRIIVL
ncbi:MAG: DsrE family protein [Verrucomicrobia bacterium]|nr:DsrE family protein [Verrucomicrobiota bacterium]